MNLSSSVMLRASTCSGYEERVAKAPVTVGQAIHADQADIVSFAEKAGHYSTSAYCVKNIIIAFESRNLYTVSNHMDGYLVEVVAYAEAFPKLFTMQIIAVDNSYDDHIRVNCVYCYFHNSMPCFAQ